MINIFLPVYNEEEIVGRNVLSVYELMGSLNKPFKIFVVDDNSKDGTGEIVRKLASEYDEIECLFFENGPSRRENLGKAFLNVPDEEILCFLDIDLASDINRVGDLINYVEEGYDVSLGSRYKGIKSIRSLERLTISKMYNGVIKVLFNSRVDDHQCGFKAFKAEKIKEVVREMGYDSSFKRGWFWDAELLLRAQKKNFSIREFPVKWEAGKQSSFNWKRELKILNYMPKLYKKIKRVN